MSAKLIIDADPGIGDALAVALALLDPDLDVLALTATSGRVSAIQATRNLQAVASLLDVERWPRIGTEQVELPPAALEMGRLASSVLNGAHGLGEFTAPDVELHQKHPAAKVLVDLVRAKPHEITLLCLGPLTNVQIALDMWPDFLGELKSLVCLAGALHAQGDVTAAAEFNVFANPEAAQQVLTFPVAKTLLPLETARKAMLSFEQWNRLEVSELTRLGRLLSLMIPFAMRASRQHLALEGMSIPDVVALTAVTRPQFFEREMLSLDVELTGHLTRGMTVFDRRFQPPHARNVEVLTDVDSQGVLDYLRTIIRNRNLG